MIFVQKKNLSSGKNNRPLSPHISIYKAQISSTFSISHRVSGILLLVLFLIGSYLTTDYYFMLNYSFYYIFIKFLYATNFFVNIVLLLLILVFFYHVVNGIRHLIWDFFSAGLNVIDVRKSAYIVFATAVVSSILFFLFI